MNVKKEREKRKVIIWLKSRKWKQVGEKFTHPSLKSKLLTLEHAKRVQSKRDRFQTDREVLFSKKIREALKKQ